MWSVGLDGFVLLFTALVVWWRAKPIKTPKRFPIALRWSGWGYWPRSSLRTLRFLTLGLLVAMSIIGYLVGRWTNDLIVGLIFPLIVLPLLIAAVRPKFIGGLVYANSEELFFQPLGLMGLGMTFRGRWHSVVRWTERDGYVDFLGESGGQRFAFYLPPVPEAIKAQIEAWLAVSKVGANGPQVLG